MAVADAIFLIVVTFYKAIGGKEGKGSRRIFVRLQGATAGA
jgi:hypothetical protein